VDPALRGGRYMGAAGQLTHGLTPDTRLLAGVTGDLHWRCVTQPISIANPRRRRELAPPGPCLSRQIDARSQQDRHAQPA
jgi:hypothetical protein